MTESRARLFGNFASNIDSSGGIIGGSGGVSVYDSAGLLPRTGMQPGDQALISSTGRLYISTGIGWYNIALINNTPDITSILDSDGQPGPFVLSKTGEATTITITATDSDGDALTYIAEADTDFNGLATISQTDNVFTINPFSEDSASSESGTITFTVSDGINQTSQINTFTLSFLLDFGFFSSRTGADITPGGGTSTAINLVSFSRDGYQVYTSGGGTTLNQYTLSTAGDFASLSSKTYGSPDATYNFGHAAQGIGWKHDGTVMYSIRYAEVREHLLSTPWDISTATYNRYAFNDEGGYCTNAYFNSDGTIMMRASFGNPDSKVISTPLSTPWDISTMGSSTVRTFNSINDNVDSPSLRGFAVKYDGTEMILADADNVNLFTMSTPFNPTTRSKVGSVTQFNFAAGSNVRDIYGLYVNYKWPNVLLGGWSQSSNYKITNVIYTV